MRPGKNKLRVKGLRKTWTTLRDDYKQYKTLIIQVQDHGIHGSRVEVEPEDEHSSSSQEHDTHSRQVEVERADKRSSSSQDPHTQDQQVEVEQENKHSISPVRGVFALQNLPDLGGAVTELADDVRSIMTSLSKFQRVSNGTYPLAFANMRKALKYRWKILRVYLQRCHAFTADVLVTKTLLDGGTQAYSAEFLGNMKARADELRGSSGDLKGSEIFTISSQERKPDETGGIANNNLGFVAVKGTNPFSANTFVVNSSANIFFSEVEIAFRIMRSNLNVLFQFWDETFKAYSLLLKEINAYESSIVRSGAERIEISWRPYQETIEKAILSIAQTADDNFAGGTPSHRTSNEHVIISLHTRLDRLIIIASKGLQIIASWRRDFPSPDEIAGIFQKVQAFSLIYLEAIETSVRTVQNSIVLGSDVIALVAYLLDPETDSNDLKDYLYDLQTKGKVACDDSTKTVAKFAEVRQSLTSMESIIHGSTIAKNAALSKYVGRPVPDEALESHHQDTWGDTSVAGPSLELLDLTVLSQGVDTFEAWCGGVDKVLRKTERYIGELRTTDNRDGIEPLQKGWEVVLKKLKSYELQVLRVRDQYLSQILRTTTDAPTGLETDAPYRALNSIVESAYKSIQIFESWSHASSDHPTLSKFIQDIRRIGLAFYEAIDLSIGIAQHEFDFSGDAIELCDLLLSADTEIEELREYIQDMNDKAKAAREECTNALDKFRKVRQELNQIVKKSPEEIMKIDAKRPSIRIPHFGDKTKPKRDLELVRAVLELNLEIIDFGTLGESIDGLESWSYGAEKVLQTAVRSSSSLRPGKDKLRVKQLQKTWTGMKEGFKQYKTRISQLQDYYSLPSGVHAS